MEIEVKMKGPVRIKITEGIQDFKGSTHIVEGIFTFRLAFLEESLTNFKKTFPSHFQPFLLACRLRELGVHGLSVQVASLSAAYVVWKHKGASVHCVRLMDWFHLLVAQPSNLSPTKPEVPPSIRV